MGNSKTPGMSTIRVDDAFDVKHMEVSLTASHRRIGALNVFLSTADAGGTPDGSVVLKSRGLGRLGNDMIDVTFSDAATAFFPEPEEAAPFSGTWMPSESFFSLTDGDSQEAGKGGSKGAWTLHLDDVAPNADKRTIFLRTWSLKLCPEEPPETANDAGANDAGANAAGAGAGEPAVEAQSGPWRPGSVIGGGGFPGTVLPGTVLPGTVAQGLASEPFEDMHEIASRAILLYLYGASATEFHVALLDRALERSVFVLKDVMGLPPLHPTVAALSAAKDHLDAFIDTVSVREPLKDRLTGALGLPGLPDLGGVLGNLAGLDLPGLGDFFQGAGVLSGLSSGLLPSLFSGLTL
ncbi:unnamed protein product [Pedinophyceae sp. YPF-701]|nr:unnamed protein product [Pedinophyceae sp. YPF-701]